MEEALYFGRKAVNGIEDCRHIHKKRRKNSPKILHITKENEKCRKYKSQPEIEYNQTKNRNNKSEKEGGYRNSVDYAEQKKDQEG